MKIDYRKLTGDLIKARKAAEIEALGEDSGPINLDTMTISLPHAHSSGVIKAVKEAGLYTSGIRQWAGKRYFINPPKCGQGSSRERATRAMFKVMNAAGWNVLMYCQRD
jgi:hypothetical protein